MATQNSINANTTTPLAIVNGGTAVNAVTTAPAATSFAGWDANKNLSANSPIAGYTTTATAAGTTTLTVGSTYQQYFTGSTTQIVQLPVTSTLVLGQTYLITNNSTGLVTIQSSGSNTITIIGVNTQCLVTCILTSGTTAASWSFNIIPVVDQWVAYTPTFTGFGTPTTIAIFSRRVGSNLEVVGRFTTGTCTAVQAQMTLGYNGTNSNVTTSTSAITTLFPAGIVVSTVAGASNIYVTVAPTVGYINFGIQNAGNSALAQANATACFNNASLNAVQCSVPIAGW